MLIDKDEYKGINVITPPNFEICPVNTEYYYDYYLNACNFAFNAQTREEFQTDPIIESSFPNGMYSMGAWFFVEDPKLIDYGISIVYSEHMVIHLQYDRDDRINLKGYCFPRLYIDPNIANLNGSDIINYYNKEGKQFGADYVKFDNPGQNWVYVFCSINTNEGKYYVNGNQIQNLKDAYDYSPYKLNEEYKKNTSYHRQKLNFPSNVNDKFVAVKFAKLNQTRIFLYEIVIFREYLYQSIYLKYFYYKAFWGIMWNHPVIPHFIFVINFSRRIYSDDWIIYLNTSDPVIITYPRVNLPNGVDPFYVKTTRTAIPVYRTLPIYYSLHNILSQNSRTHINVSTINGHNNSLLTMKTFNSGPNPSCGANATEFCISNTERFYCSGKYLNPVTLTCQNDCPTKYTIVPNIVDTTYCNYNCSEYNLNSCPNLFSDFSTTNYHLNSALWTCKNTSFTLRNYECIDNELLKESTIYFSQINVFPNFTTSFPSPYNEYIFEAWFLIDQRNFNDSRVNTSVKNYYLILHPHTIYYDYSTNEFYYKNVLIALPAVPITSFLKNKFEWMNVFIKCESTSIAGTYNFQLFTNYDFLNPNVDYNESMVNLQLKGIYFCSGFYGCTFSGFNYTSTTIRWGIAYYKDFRIWDPKTISLSVIQNNNLQYTHRFFSLLNYWDFTIFNSRSYLPRVNDLYGGINISANSSAINFNFYYNYDIRDNFDYIKVIGNDKFIRSQKNEISEIDSYIVEKCNEACKRCYDISQNTCYECHPGYLLVNQECKLPNGYFFSTPSKISAVTEINLSNIIDLDGTKIEDLNPITITFFFKFYGIIYHTLPMLSTYNLISFKNNNSCLLTFNPTTKIFEVIINNTVTYRLNNYSITKSNIYFKESDFIGKWVYFSLSIYSSPDLNKQPSMFQLQINKSIIKPEIITESINVTIDNIRYFSTNVFCLYNKMNIYNSFILGSYGITILDSLKEYKLIKAYDLFNPLDDECIKSSEIKAPDNFNSLGISCIPDFNEYLHSSLQCNNNFYPDINSSSGQICNLCDSKCNFTSNEFNRITNCYSDLSEKYCSCHNNRLSFWLLIDSTYNNHPICTKQENFNFGYYENFSTKIKVADVNEMTLEGWIYVKSYVKNYFKEANIIWDGHMRIKIYNSNNSNDGNDYLRGECYPTVELNNLTIKDTEYIREDYTESNWFYVKCSQKRSVIGEEKYYFNNVSTTKSLVAHYSTYNYKSYIEKILVKMNFNKYVDFMVMNKNMDADFGVFFIRELKIFNSYNFDFMDFSYRNAFNHRNLIAYFDGKNDLEHETFKTQIKNLIDDVSKISLKQFSFISSGYNFIKNFDELITCRNIEYWDIVSLSCKSDISKYCKMASDGDLDCVDCHKDKPYLNVDKRCYEKCPEGFYPDNSTHFCSPCHSECLSCNEKQNTNCTSCVDGKFLLRLNNTCVSNCTPFDLSHSIVNKTCIECKKLFKIS